MVSWRGFHCGTLQVASGQGATARHHPRLVLGGDIALTPLELRVVRAMLENKDAPSAIAARPFGLGLQAKQGISASH
jgi:hypothetical protein